MSSRFARYTSIIKAFVAHSIDVETFERSYLEMFKNEKVAFPSDVFEILDGLFADIDAFCPDRELISDNILSEQQLVEKCRQALSKLQT